ncbi:MAG: hypothetical protein WC485_03635 [Opitutaceae bacterium]
MVRLAGRIRRRHDPKASAPERSELVGVGQATPPAVLAIMEQEWQRRQKEGGATAPP